MLDWEGDMIPHHKRRQVLLDDVPLDEGLVASLQLKELELLGDFNMNQIENNEVPCALSVVV